MEIVRVTESLDYFVPRPLVDWFVKMGKVEAGKISRKALKVGTRVHDIIAGTADPRPKEMPEVVMAMRSYNLWLAKHPGTFTNIQRLNDPDIGLSGEPDKYWEEEAEVLDFKNAKQITPHNFFQLGGYARLIIKTCAMPLRSLGILRLDKEHGGEPEYVRNRDLGLSVADCIDAYESAFKHYRYHTHIDQLLRS